MVTVADGCEFLQYETLRTIELYHNSKFTSRNPLRGMTYRKARDLTSILYSSEGKDTLTVRNHGWSW
jgi:hypothetical protein